MSKSTYSLASLKTLGLATAVSLLATGCAQNELATPEAPTSSRHHADYTGEDLFRGIFFFEGQVAAQVPSFDSYRALLQKSIAQNPKLPAERAQTVNALVQAVQQLDPTYFGELKQAIRSQNFEQIKAAIRKGTALNEAAALKALPTPGDKQAFLQRRQVIQAQDMARYNFKKQKDIELYVKDTHRALTDAGFESTEAIQQAYVFVYQQTDVFAYQYSSVYIAESVHAWFSQLADQSRSSQLEVDLLIKELSVNLN